MPETAPTPRSSGTVALRCRFHPVTGLLLCLVFGGLTAVTADLLFFQSFAGEAPDSAASRLACGLVLVLSVAGLGFGVKQLVAPSPIVTGTDRGLILHLDVLKYRREGYFLPWSRVRSMELVDRTMRKGTSRHRVRTVAVGIDPEGEPVPLSRISYRHEGAPDVVHVDAFIGSPRGEALLQELRELHRRYG